MRQQTEPSSKAADALIKAGIEIFGNDGYNGASNRALAEAAGVNQALIAYHFGNKEGLYLSVFRAMADEIGGHFEQMAGEIESTIEVANLTQANMQSIATHCIDKLLTKHVEIILQPHMKSYAKLILREQFEPTEAFHVLYDGMLGRVLNLLALLIARVIGVDKPSKAEKLSAMMMMGQVVILRASHATTIHFLKCPKGIQSKEITLIQQQLTHHTQGILAALRENAGKN